MKFADLVKEVKGHVEAADYSAIAGEYYDAQLHPTCASLRDLSSQYLVPRLTQLSGRESVLEVGVGKSIVAPLWNSLQHKLSNVILLDSSIEMLSYSAEWESRGARLLNADARNSGLADSSVDVIVSSLGDPYNTALFWSEVARIIRPGGRCYFTIPAPEWAEAFRPAYSRCVAEFVRTDGAVLMMPSPVLNEEEQVQLFAQAGLKLFDVEAFTTEHLASPVAPKLLCVPSNKAVVRGYSVGV